MAAADAEKRAVRRLLIASALLLFATTAFAQRTLVVYLPDSPAESAKKLAESVTDLAQSVSQRSGVPFELKFFRKAEDCAAFVAANRRDIGLIVAPPEFIAELPDDLGLAPIYQFSRSGKETYRRIVIVRSADPARSLADLRGRTISVVQPFARSAFRNDAPAFRAIVPAADDQTAAANVLYGGSDAALVSELNPVAAAHIGKELRVIHTTGNVPLPIVAIRGAAFNDREREAVESAFMASQTTLAAIQVTGLARLGGREETPRPPEEKKQLEIVGVSVEALDLPAPSTASLTVPVMVAMEVPEIVIPEQ
jgi:ABC-type phosphate/phosphonate transport system substrate-binding protein